MNDEKEMFGTREAAEFLGVSKRNIKYHVEQGNLIGEKINNKTRVFLRSELEAFKAKLGNVGKPMAKDESRYQAEREEIRKAMNNPDEPEVARKARALYLMYEQNYTRNSAYEELGVSYQAVDNWHNAWKDGGIEALKPRRRGRKPGTTHE